MSESTSEHQAITDPYGLYLHIPFCKKACIYCNFHFSTSLQHRDELIDAMIAELEVQRRWLGERKLSTVYFGGGTPSQLTIHQLQRIFDAVRSNYVTDAVVEYTLEVNAEDITESYLNGLKTTPVNRLSIGIQSFHDRDLQFMNRAHNGHQAENAIKNAQDAGFGNISIDLIYGVPGASHSDWEYNLSQLNTFSVPHFSAYALTVEERTALSHGIKKKKIAPVDPDHAAAQFELLTQFAATYAYEHYEISNFATSGHRAIHNTNYWLGKHYLGIGPSAHSFNGEVRQWNVANNALYTQNLLKDKTLTTETETLTPVQQVNEYIMTSLRTIWGCSINHVGSIWGDQAAKALDKACLSFIKNGWLNLSDDTIYLTPSGKLFTDKITTELFFGEDDLK